MYTSWISLGVGNPDSCLFFSVAGCTLCIFPLRGNAHRCGMCRMSSDLCMSQQLTETRWVMGTSFVHDQ